MTLSRFFCLFLFVSTVSVQAQKNDYYTSQDFDVSLSKPYPVIDALKKLYLSSSEHVVAVKITRKGYMIQSFDSRDLREIAKKEFQGLERNETFEYAIELNGRFYFFFSRTDKDANVERLLVKEIDPLTANLIGAEQNAITVNGIFASAINWPFMLVHFGRDNPFYRFHFEKSADQKKLMIYYHAGMKDREAKDDPERVGVYIFDDGLRPLWSKTINFKHTTKEMDIYDFTIGNSGTAYILTKVYIDGNKEQKRKNDETVNYTVELLTLENASSPEVYQTIEMPDNRFLKSALLSESSAGSMLMAGYYRNAFSPAVDGVFVFNIQANGKSIQKQYYPIPIEILNEYESKKQIRQNVKKERDDEAGLHYLYLDKFYVDDFGNLTLIGEQSFVTTKTITNSNGRTTTTYMFSFLDLLVTRIDVDGQLAWMRKVPKFQRGSARPGGMSYATLHNGKDLYLLYLDNEKNLNLPSDESPKLHVDGRGGFLTSSRIDYSTGEVTKQHVFDLEDVQGIKAYQFDTGRIVGLSSDQIAVEVYKKKKEDVWIKVGLR